MTDIPQPSKSRLTPDWLVRGVLTKLGDTFDRLTGRGWKPSSSLATSELIERLKTLLDSEAKSKGGLGTFVPHNIKLKMQWDKFSADSDLALKKLENELLTAAVDHINDKRYYTLEPLGIEVKPDYFTSGVKLFVSFDRFADDDAEAAINVIVPGTSPSLELGESERQQERSESFRLSFVENGKPREVTRTIDANARCSIGRTKENDIAIDETSVSKHHASLALSSDGRLVVADTGSTNGTFINGRRIAYGKAEPLNDRDKLNFGTVAVEFVHVPKAEEEPALKPSETPTVAIGEFEFTTKPPSEPDIPSVAGESENIRDEDFDLTSTRSDATDNRINFDFENTSEK